MKKIEKLNQECIRRNLSPGGAADLLAATLFLYQLEKMIYEKRTWLLKILSIFQNQDSGSSAL